MGEDREYFLALDIGTSFCKAVIYDRKLREITISRRHNNTYHPRPGWAEQNPSDWWDYTIACIKDVLNESKISKDDVKCIGVCGQSRGLVLVDDSLSPVAPFIPWLDTRAVEQTNRVAIRFGIEVNPYSAAAKLLWIRENMNHVLSRSRFILPCKDFIRARLTGKVATDLSDAWATGLFDLSSKRWNHELLELVEITEDSLPPLLEPWEIAGSLSKESSNETGLREDTLVVIGAGDAFCILIALSEILSESRIGIYLGSSPGIFVLSDLVKEERMYNSWEFLGKCFAGFFLSAIGVALDELKMISGLCSYEALDSEAEAVERGSGGLLLLPQFSGERTLGLRPWERAVILGLSVGHNVGHIARAMMEGTAFQLRYVMEECGLSDFSREVVLSGGGSRSTIWRRVISDVLGIPNFLLDRREVSAFGVANLAAVGSGTYRNLNESLRESNISFSNGVFPDSSYRDFYDSLYMKYRKVSEITSSIFKLC